MRTTILVAVVLVVVTVPVDGEEFTQSDWSWGGGQPGPMASWASGFTASTDVSWRSIPGQLALSSSPLAVPVEHSIAEGHYGAYGLYVFDMDLDGDMDVVGTTDFSNQVMIWFNQGGNPVTWSAVTVDDDYPGGSSVHPVDLDQDGDVDIVAAAQNPGNNLAWWRNDGGDPVVWTKQFISYSVSVACNVFAADVDSDGDIDVLSTSWTSSYIAWWRNDGGDPIVWTRLKLDDGFDGAHSAVAGDVDGDGDVDVVGTAANDAEVALFLNQGGDGVDWSKQVLSDTMGGVRYATLADVEDDGRPDVVAAAWDGQLVWWRNGGGDPITWTEQTIDTACNGGHYVFVVDVDGDGWRDVLAVAYNIDSIIWYRNGGGDPISWTPHVVAGEYTQPLTVFPGDVDGDGDLDLVTSSWGLGSFAWWEVSEFKPSGNLDSSVLELAEEPDEAWLDWSVTEPAQTALAVRIRSSDDAGELGEWSDPLSVPGAAVQVDGRYLQYRLEMSTSDAGVSPVMHEISLTTRTAIEPCVPSDTTMCLNQGRFRAEVEWRDFADETGSAQVVPYGSEDSGLFWFFAEANWEMLVKVLDGCGVNQHYWVFAAATTNVGYTLTVTDTATGSVATYANPLGVSSPAVTDATAFATCP